MSTTARDFDEDQERKKRLKREANRRSAQLSRQRKKAFIEDLKAKNAEFQLAARFVHCGRLCTPFSRDSSANT